MADGIQTGALGFSWESPIRPITRKEFLLFQKLIYKEAGIFLAEHKTALLTGRLSRHLRTLGLTSFEEYYRHLTEGRSQEDFVRMLDSVCTNETHFFREPVHFDFLKNKAFPAWKAAAEAGDRPKRVRAWSAACSTGEEPYSVAMTLLDHLPTEEGWQHEILATDLSTKVLKKAKDARWPLSKSREVPHDYLKAYMLQGFGSQQGTMKAGDAIRSLVKFQRLNLNQASYAVDGKFDLIFCRNVLIYFDQESKTKVVRRLLDHLAPEGYLILGCAETMSVLREETRSVGTAVFMRRELSDRTVY